MADHSAPRQVSRRDILRALVALPGLALLSSACTTAATPTPAATVKPATTAAPTPPVAASSPAPGGTTAAAATKAPAAGTGQKFSLRFGSVESPDDKTLYVADKFLADEVTKRSNGDLTIQYFPNSQIGAQRDLAEGVRLGTVDIAGVATPILTAYVPELAVFDLPYVFLSKDKELAFLDGPDGQTLLHDNFAKAGMWGLMWLDAGVRCIYNSKRAVKVPDDMKGLKIRVEENPIRVGTFNAMGAQATPMAFSEVYNALQQKVIDGFEQPPVFYVAFKFYEVTKFASKSDHFITPAVRMISKATWDKLPADMQRLMTTVAKEAETNERKVAIQAEEDAWKTMVAQGVTVDDVDKQAFRATVKPFVDQQSAKIDKAWWDKVTKAAG